MTLFIVTPHHRQRCAIQSRLVRYMTKCDINLQIITFVKSERKRVVWILK
jgi:hypothetical protein